MKPLRRLLEDDGASDEVRRLLRAGKRSQPISGEVLRRGERRVAAAVMIPVGLSALLWNGGTLLAAVIGVGVGATIAVAGPALVSANDAPPIEVAVETRQRRSAGPTRSAPQLESPPADPIPPQPEPRVRIAPAPGTDTLREEAKLLERASRLRSTDPDAALALVQQHRERFARGKLAVEREILEVEALSRLGRTAHARTRLERLLRDHENTLYSSKLQRLAKELDARRAR